MSTTSRATAIAVTIAATLAAVPVFHVFRAVFGVSLVGSLVAALTGIGTTAFALYLLALRPSSSTPTPVRAMAAALSPAWIAVALVLILADVALSLGASEAPGALVAFGQVTAAAIPFMAVASAAAFAFAASDKANGVSVKSLAIIYFANGAKFAIAVIASLAAVRFGLSRGLDPALSAVLGVALAACFALSCANLSRAYKERESLDAKAKFGLWAFAAAGLGLFVFALLAEAALTLARYQYGATPAIRAGATPYAVAVCLSFAFTAAAHFLLAHPANGKAGQSTKRAG